MSALPAISDEVKGSHAIAHATTWGKTMKPTKLGSISLGRDMAEDDWPMAISLEQSGIRSEKTANSKGHLSYIKDEPVSYFHQASW